MMLGRVERTRAYPKQLSDPRNLLATILTPMSGGQTLPSFLIALTAMSWLAFWKEKLKTRQR